MIPFLGRLHPWEYVALLASFILIGLEGVIRIITLALPTPIINLFYRSSRRLFNYLSSPSSRKTRNTKKKIVTSIAQASDFVELCELFGYAAEEHIVQTKDGYLLGLHRLGWKKGEEDTVRVNSGPGSVQKKVVYLHHGLMMNSEVWVCLTEQERCLPFLLVDRGYDVWVTYTFQAELRGPRLTSRQLGNNRGNKYSKKSVNCAPTDAKFWSFSIDQFAFHDIPDSIDYILSSTGQPSLSYVGFSQGTAQAFATLSIHPTLNEKVDVFVALAPAMSPPGLSKGIVNSFVKTSPEVLFLAFGRRSLLSSATMWQALLYPPIFVRLIDMSLGFLFGWKTKNISPHQKLAAYPHLYSFTSTKSVVHWFQIIRNGKFQMYDDEVQGPWSVSDGARFYKVPRFPTRNIKTPIVILYGGTDSLVDMKIMLKELPKHAITKEIPHYEHLDFLWAHDVQQEVFPHVFRALDRYAGPKESGGKPNFLDMESKIYADVAGGSPSEEDDTYGRAPHKHTESIKSKENTPTLNRSSPAASASQKTNQTTTSRPEGWWSSDEVPESEPSTPVTMTSPSVDNAHLHAEEANQKVRRSGSRNSFESFGERGITIGKARVVGGVNMDDAIGAGTGSGSEKRSKKRRKP
jgi:lysosomal acid lipase/cholesteryl ester hydrolase